MEPKKIIFEWKKSENSKNKSCVFCEGDGYFAYVLIPFEKGNDPDNGIGTWNANPNHRGKMGFASKEDAIQYCEETITNQAIRELKQAEIYIKRWA